MKFIHVSKMMNTKLISDSVSLVKYIQVSKMMNKKLMSDSASILKCIHHYMWIQAHVRFSLLGEMHTGELDDEHKFHVRLFLHIEMHTGAYKLMSDSVSIMKCIQFS